MPFCFHADIIEEEKIKFKRMIKGIKDMNNVGIYLDSRMIDSEKINLSDFDYIKCFNELSVTFYISRDIFVIAPHFKNIINFVNSRDKISSCHYFAKINIINDDTINCIIIPLPKYIYNKATNNYSFEKVQEDAYYFGILGDDIINIKKGVCSWIGTDGNITHGEYRYLFPFNLKWIDYLDYNLIDQLIVTKNIKKDKKNNLLCHNYLSSEVKIIKNNNTHCINFTNCNDFNKLEKYLIKRFGTGKFIHEIDRKSVV